jgi:hypothetical protein
VSNTRDDRPGAGSSGVRNRLRRDVERDRLAKARIERLLGMRGDLEAVADEVERLVGERDDLRARIEELEAGGSPRRPSG